MLNKVMVIGYLGQDPEVKHLSGGQTVCTMSVATTEKWNDKSGNKQERTEWHTVNVWGRMAESCAKYLAKGSQVFVEGRIQTRTWDDKEGNKRYKTEIVAQNVKFLSKSSKREDAPRYDSPDYGPSSPSDDIPF